jgi:NAD(P)H-flavin reductase
MRAVSGAIPPQAQAGLKDTWALRGYFLACSCIPGEDLEIVPAGADIRFSAVIADLRPLSSDVLKVSLRCEDPIEFQAGQYVTVVRADGLARSYSIASLPEEGLVDLHIRRIPNGRMSGWFHTTAQHGDRVTLSGPSGECFYVPGREQQPLLLAGTGTGLAPLYGIVRDALARGHAGEIHLFHGALQRSGLYLVDELRTLAAQYPQLRYTPTVLRGEPHDGIVVGSLLQTIDSMFTDLMGWRGFVCGDPSIVTDLKKQLFLAGMASRDIYADSFLPAA